MLEAASIALDRGARRIVSDVSFVANAGDALVIRGPNGIGKSTLLRTLAGLLPLPAGHVRFGDTPLSDRAAFSELVAYAGHLDAIKPALSVQQNIQVWAGVFGATAERADNALDLFGLTPLADRPAAQCSAGQKRRLGLARLMVADRPLWLLDEPTVSLDAESTAIVASMVTDHQAQGGIALIASHIDLGLAAARTLDLGPYRTKAEDRAGQTDAFLQGNWGDDWEGDRR